MEYWFRTEKIDGKNVEYEPLFTIIAKVVVKSKKNKNVVLIPDNEIDLAKLRDYEVINEFIEEIKTKMAKVIKFLIDEGFLDYDGVF
ncbi:MAG: hypothetical protein Q9M37_03540 [Desulfonauticus sp.]|nr:hypothetical protein [Desulfonauticus sp.]